MLNGSTALMLAAGTNSATNGDRRGINVIDFGQLEPESKVLPAVMAALDNAGGINVANNAGDTALHAAVTHRYETVIQYLVDHGADVNARNRQGLTPLGLVAARRIGGEKPTASTVAGAANSGGAIGDEAASQRIAELLLKLGAKN